MVILLTLQVLQKYDDNDAYVVANGTGNGRVQVVATANASYNVTTSATIDIKNQAAPEVKTTSIISNKTSNTVDVGVTDTFNSYSFSR